jgi:hypothetical protein
MKSAIVAVGADAAADAASGFMKQKDFAARQGVQPSAVSNWKRAGLLVFGATPETRKMIDVAASEARLADRRDAGRGRPPTAIEPEIEREIETVAPEPGKHLSNVRTRLLEVQTDGKLLDNKERAGKLVPLIEYQRRATALPQLLRDRLLAQFRSHREQLAAISDPRLQDLRNAELINEVFEQMATDIEAGALSADDDAGEDDPVENEALDE